MSCLNFQTWYQIKLWKCNSSEIKFKLIFRSVKFNEMKTEKNITFNEIKFLVSGLANNDNNYLITIAQLWLFLYNSFIFPVYQFLSIWLLIRIRQTMAKWTNVCYCRQGKTKWWLLLKWVVLLKWLTDIIAVCYCLLSLVKCQCILVYIRDCVGMLQSSLLSTTIVISGY